MPNVKIGRRTTPHRYEQLRLTHDTLMSWSMSAFNELFSRAAAPAAGRGAATGLAGATGIARRTFARRALGLSGESSALARGAGCARAGRPDAETVAVAGVAGVVLATGALALLCGR
jgi:hypothetical protein